MADARTIFDGPGASCAHGRAVDWSATALGPIDAWPSALAAVVRLVLETPIATALWLGPAFTLVHNDGYLDVLGPARAHAMGRPGADVWGPSWDLYRGEILRVRDEGIAIRRDEVRVRIERVSGEEEAFFTYSLSPVRDEDGRVLGVMNPVEELTHVVRARTEREERLAFALSSAQLGAWDIDLVDGAGETSGEHHTIFGYETPPSSWSYEVFLGHVVPEDRARVEENFERIRRTGHVVALDCRIRRVDGAERWVRASGRLRTDPNGHVHMSGVVQDVTSQKVADEVRARDSAALRASEARHAFLLELSDALRSLDDVDAIPAVACRMLAAHAGADRAFYAVVTEGEARIRVLPDHARAGLASLEGELPFAEVAEEVGSLRAGRDIVVPDVGSSPALTPSGQRVARDRGLGAVIVTPLLRNSELVATMNVGFAGSRAFDPRLVELVHEVGERTWNAIARARAEAATSLANAQLREADRRKNDFLGMLSHELRNPLSPMKNGLYVLERAAPGSPQAARALAVVQRQLLQLERLVDDLLDVTRITRSKIQLQSESVELGALVRGTFEDYRAAFESAEVTATYTEPEGELFVVGDRNRLAQVVGNLLQNAAKFSSRGGEVHVSLARAGDSAELRVADSGVGLSPEIAARIFEPFVQADRTLDRSRGGLGLGLALVKGLVEQHGGAVSARSAGPGKGAEFVVRLPLREPEKRALHLPVARKHATRKVLVIEDNADAADSLRELLELEGHAVEVARTGPDGIALAREHAPDVVLCDIGLPGMSGYDVARTFRADPELSGVPLVAVSGYALPEDLARASEAGFVRHMAKPPSLEKIERVLAMLP